jgi:putative FmdB family regulatory protein
MPTYQYACTNTECGNRFELVQSFTDPSVSDCPVCGQAVRKVYGSVGVVFKGSGFYRTDSRSGSGSSTVASEPSAPATPAATPAAPASTPASTPASAAS